MIGAYHPWASSSHCYKAVTASELCSHGTQAVKRWSMNSFIHEQPVQSCLAPRGAAVPKWLPQPSTGTTANCWSLLRGRGLLPQVKPGPPQWVIHYRLLDGSDWRSSVSDGQAKAGQEIQWWKPPPVCPPGQACRSPYPSRPSPAPKSSTASQQSYLALAVAWQLLCNTWYVCNTYSQQYECTTGTKGFRIGPSFST